MASHDLIFKATFEDPAAARALIRAAIPEVVLSKIDLGSIRVVPGNFLRGNLRQRFADLLLQVSTNGSPLLLFVLFEHKSKAERFTVIDLFDSVGGIWREWLSKNESPRFVPRVLPIVFHHAHRAWDQPKDLRPLFAGDETVHDSFRTLDPTFPVSFVDLGGIENPEEACSVFPDPAARCVAYLMMISRMRDFLARLIQVGIDLLSPAWNQRRGTIWARAVLEYIDACLPEDAEVQELFTMIGDRIHPEAEREFRTLREVTNERMRAEGHREGLREGFEKGIVKGIEKGIEKGRALGEARAIATVLRARFGVESESAAARVARIANPEILTGLAALAAIVPTLLEFMNRLETLEHPK